MKGGLLVDRLDILRLERWAANNKGVQDDTNRPCIHLKAVAISGIKKDLGRDVIRRPTYGFLPLSGVLDQSSKTKVAHFDIHIRVKEQVAEFEIPMDNLVRVHVVACANKLDHEEARFRLSEPAPTT